MQPVAISPTPRQTQPHRGVPVLRSRRRALGHEQDVGGLPAAELAQQFIDLNQIAGLRHDERELPIGAGAPRKLIEESLQHGNVQPAFFVPR